MVVGFAQRNQTVSEAMVPSGEDYSLFLIEFATLRTSERRTILRLWVKESTATFWSWSTWLHYDVQFNNFAYYSNFLYEPEAELTTPRPLRASVRNDFTIEDEECFTLRVSLYGSDRREVVKCNEDDNIDAESYYCEHTVCIEDDDGMCVIAEV